MERYHLLAYMNYIKIEAYECCNCKKIFKTEKGMRQHLTTSTHCSASKEYEKLWGPKKEVNMSPTSMPGGIAPKMVIKGGIA